MMWYLVVVLLAAPALGAKLENAYTVSYKSGRIVGGSTATAGQFPYQAGLDRLGGHWCGGSIINNNHVLTAAHCVEAAMWQYDVYLGQHNRNNRDGNVQRPIIRSIRIHPDYTGNINADGLRADIAVIQTDNFNLNSRVQTIALAGSNQNFDGQQCQISGWGETNSGASNTLLWANMRAQSLSQCRGELSGIENYHICFKSDNSQSGACSGDSGGPARCGNVVAGVASWVTVNIFNGNCLTSNPSVYARVSTYRNWILNNS